MSIAADLTVLKRRLDDYVWREPSMPLVHLRQILAKHFAPFPRVAIVGGLVRDLARKGPTGFRSDVDLVVEAPNRDVIALAQQLKAEPNRFGGFAYRHTHWKIDFWALESTWASTNGYVNVTKMNDLTRCTFFNSDAVLYDLKARTIVCNKDYLHQLQRGDLEINLLPTPSIRGNLLRSVRRLLLWNVQAGPKLSGFIEEHLSAHNFCAIRATERTIYPNPILSRFDSASDLSQFLFEVERRPKIDISFAVQLPLPGL